MPKVPKSEKKRFSAKLFLRVSLALISIPIGITLAALPGIFFLYWIYRILSINLFLILLVPALILSYAVFILLLCLFMSQFRKIIPLVPDGLYNKWSEEYVYFETRVLFYHVFIQFVIFFNAILNHPYLHRAFGAKIGKNTLCMKIIMNPERIEIGENCIMGHLCTLTAHAYANDKLFIKRVKIGNNSTVGAQSVIFPGVEIGDNCIIGANTTIAKNKKIPSGTVWISSKAKQLKKNKSG